MRLASIVLPERTMPLLWADWPGPDFHSHQRDFLSKILSRHYEKAEIEQLQQPQPEKIEAFQQSSGPAKSPQRSKPEGYLGERYPAI